MKCKGMMLKIVCCNCGKEQGFKACKWDTSTLKNPITHNICDECGPKLYPSLWINKEKN